MLTVLSSAMSASGLVMIREINPTPAAENRATVIPAPKIKSFAHVVVAAPLLAIVPLPAAPAPCVRGAPRGVWWHAELRVPPLDVLVVRRTVLDRRRRRLGHRVHQRLRERWHRAPSWWHRA